MPVDTKLIFGLRTSEDVTLTVTGQPGPQAPDLLITTSGQEKDTEIAYSAGAWIAPLTAGDYVVRMEAPGDLWFESGVSFTLSAVSTIVIYDAAASPKPMGWTATTGAVDPKDPWPPPLAAEPLPNPTWLGETLQVLSDNVSISRGPRSSHTLPRNTAR
jgi:hypothetical protein